MHADIAILGGGFGGSLAALVLRRAGFEVALIDRGGHPRFAIGESSTPTANLVLRRLGERYHVPELVALSRYGSWRREHPDVMRGLKRGFSYFGHAAGEPFASSPAHDRELLVAASSSDEVSDTQWLRADVDAFLFRLAAREGVVCLDHTALDDDSLGPESRLANPRTPWALWGTRQGERVDLTARFLIDATGERALLAARWQTEPPPACLTRSRAVFAHFEGLPRWETELRHGGIPTTDHPFRCDDAALHHLFDAGWMWQLRFDNDITSCGFALDMDRAGNASPDSATEWKRWLDRLPSVRHQFRNARIVAPVSGLVSTGRLQRRLAQLVGPGWAALPGTAGFIDPLFSPGNAHIVSGVEYLAGVLEQGLRDGSSLTGELAHYARRVRTELDVIDRTIAAAYRSLPSFEAFCVATSLYFVRAIAYERGCGGAGAPAFLMADDEGLDRATSAVEQALARLHTDWPSLSTNARRSCEQRLVDFARRQLEPWNPAGLLAPSARHMHARTAME